MKSVTSFLKAIFEIIRWKNIAIALATLVLINVVPQLLDPISCRLMYDYQFVLIISAVACAMIFGNIHNDLCDILIDQVNRPTRALVVKKISSRSGWLISWLSIATGFLLISYLAYIDEQLIWLVYYALAVLILYIYNIRLKCIPLLGNLVIAGFCAAVVLIPMYFYHFNGSNHETAGCYAIRLIPAFAWLAFVVNLIREIIKDLQDITGDGIHGCMTVPVYFGESVARFLVYFLSLVLFISIAIWISDYLDAVRLWKQLVILFLLVAPFLFFLWSFVRRKNYQRSQQWLKIELLAGLLIFLIASMI